MKHLSAKRCLSTVHPVDLIKNIKKITLPYSEHDIMEIQDAFLTNGYHAIQVENVVQGRLLLNTFLRALNCYRDLAVLTLVDTIPAHNDLHVYDIYKELVCDGYLPLFNDEQIDTFFLDSFYFDFMWIEATQELLAADWFTEFEQKLIDLKIDQHIPIIFVSYVK